MGKTQLLPVLLSLLVPTAEAALLEPVAGAVCNLSSFQGNWGAVGCDTGLRLLVTLLSWQSSHVVLECVTGALSNLACS